MANKIEAQALPSGAAVWAWVLANSPAIAAAVDAAISADRPREVWAAIKEIGDLLIELVDPEKSAISASAFSDVPWDKIIQLVLPVVIEFIRRRREQRGA